MTQLAPLRRFAACLDGRRIPLNSEERSHMQGDIPYWGANGVVDEISGYLFDEQLVLLGEDGAPFDDPSRAVAFLVNGKTWVNNHMHVLRALEGTDPRYLTYALNSIEWMSHVGGSTRLKLTQDDMMAVKLPKPPLSEQQAIADYLDAETARIDALIAKKQQLIHLLEERIDAAITEVVGRSEIVGTGSEPGVEIRRVLQKLDSAPVVDEMITAFRDGQVTSRAARGKEGFTNSWTDNSRVQGVQVGDVVVHGLDGFSGAIGDSEADGVCSPVYHVCRPRDGGDPAFYSRLLRRLALTGYLGNFAVSTRERAVDFRNWDLFGRIPIPLVPIEQQRQIGNRIRTLRPLVGLVEKSEALASERKSALISRAVSGELSIAGVS